MDSTYRAKIFLDGGYGYLAFLLYLLAREALNFYSTACHTLYMTAVARHCPKHFDPFTKRMTEVAKEAI